uniref:Cadherin-89D n=1 Tax=Cacopsylla melanoneura TaxID=428564 RepID=A0A8D8TNP1_9HEMI
MSLENCVKSVILFWLGFFLIGISCDGEVTPGPKQTTPNTLAPDASTKHDNPGPPSATTLTPIPPSPTTAVSPVPSPTIPPPPVEFKLEKEEYKIKFYSEQIGVLEQFKTEPRVDGIQYELEYTYDMKKQLEKLLSLDSTSGVLRTLQTMTPGEYKFDVKASYKQKDNSVTIKTAKVHVTVVGVTVCKEKDDPQFQYAFLKKYVTENKAEVVYAVENKKDHCEYLLANQIPPGDFFKLDPVTGKLETKEIDREDKLFHDQIQAHIKIDISIKCSSARNKRSVQNDNLEDALKNFQNEGMMSLSHYRNPFEELQARVIRGILNYQLGSDSKSKDDKTSPKQEDTSTKPSNTDTHNCFDVTKEKAHCDSIIEDKILYNTHFMKLLIFIQDANDNAPEFVQKDYFFGYPDKKLAEDIVPDEIGKVQATDKDVGINAALKYSVKNVPEIIIDPCTGAIYPHYAHFKYEKLTFQVTATDRDGKADGLSQSVNVMLDILEGYHVMKMLVKRSLTQSNKEIISKIEEHMKASVKILEVKTVPSLEDITGAVELNTEGYDILEYYIIYMHEDNNLLDMNHVRESLKQNEELKKTILWVSVLGSSPYNYVKSKSFVSTVVVLMLILCMGSLVFYMAYIRTGKYYRCLNYFKKSNSTTPLEMDESSIGNSDYVVSFARMNHVNPTFNVVETDRDKDFTPVTLKAYDTSNNQIINVDELTPAPPILVNSNSNSRRNSMFSDDNLVLPVGNERQRRKSSVSFNEIVEQYHTVHNP